MTDVEVGIMEFPDGTKRILGLMDPQDVPVIQSVFTMMPGHWLRREVLVSAVVPCQKAITRRIKEKDEGNSEVLPEEVKSPRMGRAGRD